jgi:hypothetical protein
MPYEVPRTTADHVVGAVDAALQSPSGVTAAVVAGFLECSEESALSALTMAAQLGLVRLDGGTFVPDSSCAPLLVVANRDQRTAVMRFLLEQYHPFCLFRSRLHMTEGVPSTAAAQTRALCGLASHRDEILATLLDLGTFSSALATQGGGLYLAPEGEEAAYMAILRQVVDDRTSAEFSVRRRIGFEEAEWVDGASVLEHMVTAYQRLAYVETEIRAPIVHAANAIEGLLVQVATSKGVQLAGATGINAKLERLAAGQAISRKHKHVGKYLGHMRNAAEHGPDPDIGQPWGIGSNAAVEYVHSAQTYVGSVVSFQNGICRF